MIRKDFQKLLFVYNANSGIRNAILDSMHKVFSPSIYECSLCDVTFGVVSENKAWKKFRKESQYEMVFLHKDEFTKEYVSESMNKSTFPIVFLESAGGLEVFISTEELNHLKTSQELIRLVKERIK
ncbi:GTPase [Flagellimonas pacifica]|uniref:GTPase n=1 Tax=Flagellimonas pacifica TaxID=1247520 RepID=A0A285MUI6_9FLAO|nr:GTPase [Allomuricauda parva]SNZ00835.1 hypothetical protein SAMN06265377_2662 [Allomuricauda parva]